ncbi:hypothetical protein KC363_g6451 [Hortaea werneckii]|uniref:Methyltransferase domain-containing protein n=1 Tax=Hortaea werneckii TaxID=91943 RepID=A0A3M7F8Y9_HORWE|nr:hypothetical protein KC361_g455 [Hortaea werneckii]KAI6887154.1 hypothetical protein KC325_g2306 [Hortaea werneckii]KAI6989804.1 hypothetical protein KC359_g7009 [Hortaea werneckii]KAI7148443.1 hypothetical protein KC344_g1933 [Hortaea werneckii]KAI7171045.1 hypothetical protein KC360_g6395 [Hortaea werneckii]
MESASSDESGLSSPIIDRLVSSYLHSPKARSNIVLPQFIHRMALAQTWQILPGSRILDIGCGQGESSLVLAELLGPGGHVTGIDTASHDYGSPFNIGDAQSYIKKSIYGQRIDFLQTDAARLLSTGEEDARQPAFVQPFDGAILSHSLWYFEDSESISSLFRVLSNASIRRVHVADYSYEASLPEQVPHVLASRAQALVHAFRQPRPTRKDEPNVRAAPHPAKVIEIASAEGFTLVKEDRITPGPGLRDGHWESSYVQMAAFRDSIVQEGLDAESVAEVLALVEQVEQAHSQMVTEGCNIARTMDVWCATFELV